MAVIIRERLKAATTATLAIIVALSLMMPAPIAWAADDTEVVTPGSGELAEQPQGEATETNGISGVTDFDLVGDQVELFSISGDLLINNKPLYISVEKKTGEATVKLFDHQKWTADTTVKNGEYSQVATTAQEAAAQENDEPVVRIVRMYLGQTIEDLFANETTYSIAVYTQPVGGKAISKLSLYPVKAALTDADGNDVSANIIGTTTAQSVETLAAPQALYADGSKTPYKLQGEGKATLENGAYIIKYQQQSEAEATAVGTITYSDVKGNIIRVQTVDLDTTNETGATSVEIPSTFTFDSKNYRVVSLSGSTVELSYAQANATIKVMEIAQYQAVIEYKSGSETLWTDTLDVDFLSLEGQNAGNYGTYKYALPNSFSIASSDPAKGKGVEVNRIDGVKLYEFDSVLTPNDISGDSIYSPSNATDNSQILTFTSDMFKYATTTDANGNPQPATITVQANYTNSLVDKRVTFTVVEKDGQTGADLGKQKFEVTDSKDQTYTPAEREINGKKYVPWSGNTKPLNFRWTDLAKSGTQLMQYVYYVPEDYVATPYDVTVEYRNIVGGRVLKTETIHMDPERDEYAYIQRPESFEQDGETYVRLAGQEDAIRHAFPTGAQTYAVYYRNVNDELNSTTVIAPTQIIDSDLTGDGTTVAGVAADGDNPAGVTAGDGAVVINDDGNPLVGQDGEDVSLERIDDDENPLAEGQEGLDAQNSAPLYAGLGIGALVILGLIAFFVLRKRKQTAVDRANL